MRRSLCEENDFVMKNFTCTANMTLRQCLHDHPITYFVFNIYYNTKVYNWQSYVDIITHIFGVDIFNVCIRFIWLNPTYVIPSFCWTILYIYHANGKIPHYHKWALIWSFVFVCIAVTDNDFISDFIDVVNSVSIFADIIFIDLCLIFLMY